MHRFYITAQEHDDPEIGEYYVAVELEEVDRWGQEVWSYVEGTSALTKEEAIEALKEYRDNVTDKDIGGRTTC